VIDQINYVSRSFILREIDVLVTAARSVRLCTLSRYLSI